MPIVFIRIFKKRESYNAMDVPNPALDRSGERVPPFLGVNKRAEL
jgi:hypothetical protein